MSSFISPFRAFVIAALAIGAIEAAVLALGRPEAAARNNFLDLAYPAQEPLGRSIIYEKIRYFADRRPEIIQLGDSSGLMGIRGDVVETYLPEGVAYANLSCCATQGYRGPLGVIKFMLHHNPDLEMVVLHQSPTGNHPRADNNTREGVGFFDLGNKLHDQYVGLKKLVHPPSLGFRRAVTEQAYYGPLLAAAGVPLDPERPITDHDSFDLMLDTIGENGGYIPDPEIYIDLGPWGEMEECELVYETRPSGPFGLNLFGAPVSYVEETYGVYAELARKHGFKLMIAYQVMPCPRGTGEGSRAVREAIARFQEKYPEVAIPFDIVDPWPPEKFAVAAHVRDAHTVELSHRLGEAVGAFYRD